MYPGKGGGKLKKRKIVICGNSLFLDGIEASLGRRAEFALRHVNSAQPEALETLMRLEPDVVIFDKQQEQGMGELHVLFQSRRAPLLIGLDLNSKHATCADGPAEAGAPRRRSGEPDPVSGLTTRPQRADRA